MALLKELNPNIRRGDWILLLREYSNSNCYVLGIFDRDEGRDPSMNNSNVYFKDAVILENPIEALGEKLPVFSKFANPSARGELEVYVGEAEIVDKISSDPNLGFYLDTVKKLLSH